MNLKNTILLIIFLNIFIINFCKAKVISEVMSFVNGRVTDERNFPLSGIKVLIGISEKTTDQNGNFNFSNISTPYDITIAERRTSTAVIYKGLTISNPALILFGDSVKQYSNEVTLNTFFPKIPEGNSSIIKFISKSEFESYQTEAVTGDSSKNIIIRWPLNRSSLTGELIYIQKKKDNYQYLKRKSVTLNKNVTFQEADFYSVKERKLSSSEIKLYFPVKKFEFSRIILTASFFNYDKNSGIDLDEENGNSESYKISVPDKFSESFKIKITGMAESKDGSGFVNYNYASPGEALKIVTESPPKQETPSDNILAVDGNTRFSYSSGTGAGIYVIEFKSKLPEMNFYIVTREKETYFTYLSRDEFTSSNITFDWKVKKYLTYFNVDEFVKPVVFMNDFSYKAILFSGKRSFKTGFH